jgi:hypothetical protein
MKNTSKHKHLCLYFQSQNQDLAESSYSIHLSVKTPIRPPLIFISMLTFAFSIFFIYVVVRRRRRDGEEPVQNAM